jgi:hypothetical protein
MNRPFVTILLTLTLSLATHSQTDPNRLPVKRVVLYKNGVGYFEHSTHVHGTQELNIDFTTAQLNDVLKSLTVVDLGEGRISSVRYNSIAPLSERLKSLRLPFGEDIARDDFLTALRGARVDVKSGAATASGKLLSVEKVKHHSPDGKDVYETTEFAIVTDSGEMRSFVLSPTVSVRLADRELTGEVGRYLDLVGSSRARDLRRMTITATGEGERNVFVSYISEVPIWKSTYRIILSDKNPTKPLLQGWAIIDNTIGEDWKDVHLSLVAGAPQSFVQNISQPQYTRRPEIALPESVMLTPQSHEATLQNGSEEAVAHGAGAGGGVGYGYGSGVGSGSGAGRFAAGVATTALEGTVKDPSGAAVQGARVSVHNEETGVSQVAITDRAGQYKFTNIQAGNSSILVTSPGFQRYELSNFYLGVGRTNEIHAMLNVGTASTAIEVTSSAPTVNTEIASVSVLANRQASEAEGKSTGDFYEYDIKQAITIGKNQSALVPIVQAHLDLEKVTLWNSDSVPLHALWVKNTSGQTLDSGSFNIIEDETFAGEGLIEVLHPNERRLLSYAGDPAVHVKVEGDSDEKSFSHIEIAKGMMTMTKEQRETRKYTIRNADTTPRIVVIEHPTQDDWKLTEATPKPEESTESFYRFRVSVEPSKTSELTVEESHPDDTIIQLTNLDDKTIALLVEQKRMTPAMKQVFDKILAQKDKVRDFDRQINERNLETNQINGDQNRLRENMKALKGSPEEKALLSRYTHQLDSQEDRLAVLRKEIADLQAQRNQANFELERMVLDVNLDEKF